MWDRFIDQIIKWRWLVMAVFLGFTLFFAAQIPQAQIDPEVENQLPADFASRINLDKIDETFGGTEMIMITLEAADVLARPALKRLKKISRRLEKAPGVDKVLSLFTLKDIRSVGGELRVEPAVKRLPKTPAQLTDLRQSLRDNDLVYGNVVSKDFTAAAVIGLVKPGVDDEELMSQVRGIIEKTPGPEKIRFAGMPYLRASFSGDIFKDTMKFTPIGIVLMLIFLTICFRQTIGVLLPFGVVVIAVTVAMGLMPLLGWKIHMVTNVLPVMLIAIANDYGVHIVARYQELNRPGNTMTPAQLTKKVMSSLGAPVVYTGITTMVGLLCLTVHVIIPAQRIGLLAALGILVALAGSLVLMPAVLAALPKPKPLALGQGGGKTGKMEAGLARLARIVTVHPKLVFLILGGAALVMTSGVFWLRVDSNPLNDYAYDTPVAASARLVNQHFGGSTSLEVMATGDIKDPKVLAAIDKLEQELAKLPSVGQISSLAKVVRRLSKAMNQNDPAYDRIPASRQEIAQYILLYSMSGDPADLERMVDFSYGNAVISARINQLSSQQISQLVGFTEKYIAEHPQAPFTIVGGFAAVWKELSDHIVRGQNLSLSLSLFLVGVLVAVAFRSMVAGLLAAGVLAGSVGVLFGLMGYLGITLNVTTALLSSIMVGVGVDYTIHFLWRYREELALGKPASDAMLTTLTTTGRGIIFNALSVMVGFVVLFTSNFLPMHFLGFLVVVSISSCLIGSLSVLPALCLMRRPKFLHKAVLRPDNP